MRQKREGKLKDFLISKLKSLASIGILFLILLLSISLIGNVSKMISIKKQIREETKKTENLKAENTELERKLIEAKSEENLERQLRDKLGLARKGEIVLILPEDEELKKIAPNLPEEEEVVLDPNWKKWLKLFL